MISFHVGHRNQHSSTWHYRCPIVNNNGFGKPERDSGRGQGQEQKRSIVYVSKSEVRRRRTQTLFECLNSVSCGSRTLADNVATTRYRLTFHILFIYSQSWPFGTLYIVSQHVTLLFNKIIMSWLDHSACYVTCLCRYRYPCPLHPF